MNNNQELEIVMFPTDVSNRINCTEGLIVKCIQSWTPIGEDTIKVNTLSISKNWSSGVLKYYQPQHLYVLSDEEKKENDWVFHIANKQIFKYTKGENKYWKKIIATTDSSLKIGDNTGKSGDGISLPKIPQSFIEDFIIEYNKGNEVKKVLMAVNGNQFNQNNEILIYITPTSPNDVLELFYVENDSMIHEWSNKKRLILEYTKWLTKNNYHLIKKDSSSC